MQIPWQHHRLFCSHRVTWTWWPFGKNRLDRTERQTKIWVQKQTQNARQRGDGRQIWNKRI